MAQALTLEVWFHDPQREPALLGRFAFANGRVTVSDLAPRYEPELYDGLADRTLTPADGQAFMELLRGPAYAHSSCVEVRECTPKRAPAGRASVRPRLARRPSARR
jgi:hypothetical protein